MFSVEDFIPAGFELVNFDLDTENKTLQNNDRFSENNIPHTAVLSWNAFSPMEFFSTAKLRLLSAVGIPSSSDALTSAISYPKLYPDFQELRDDRLYLFAQDLPAGTYSYEYYVRATTPGTFSHLPAIASEMYFPENFGRTSGSIFTVDQ